MPEQSPPYRVRLRDSRTRYGAMPSRYLRRDSFACRYCSFDGSESFANWLLLSRDHLLPIGHPDRDDDRYIVAACRFCNEAHNRTVFDVDGKTPAEIVEIKRTAIQ